MAGSGEVSRDGPTRETPAQRHNPSSGDTNRYGLEAPHNPKVAGSNPAPATNEGTKAQVVDLGFRRYQTQGGSGRKAVVAHRPASPPVGTMAC
jgi:hypothetical protein